MTMGAFGATAPLTARRRPRSRGFVVRPLIALLIVMQIAATPVEAATLVFVNVPDPLRTDARKTGFCVPDERAATIKALQLAQVRIKRVTVMMREQRAAVLPRFIVYFGQDSVAEYDAVVKNYQSALDYMADTNKERLLVYCRLANREGEPCSNTIRSARLLEPGLAPPQTDDIRGLEAFVLCGRFFQASGTFEHTQWGSIFHEATHVAFDAVDHDYDVEDLAELAIRWPETARMNAETYRRFAEMLTAGTTP